MFRLFYHHFNNHFLQKMDQLNTFFTFRDTISSIKLCQNQVIKLRIHNPCLPFLCFHVRHEECLVKGRGKARWFLGNANDRMMMRES